jgi:uncharacterized protein YciI
MICMCLMDYVDPAAAARVRPAHRAYMHRLIAEGRVVCAGSFPPDHDGGLFLYDVSSLEEAQRLVDEDPYLREGAVRTYKLRRYEVHGGDFARLRVEGA